MVVSMESYHLHAPDIGDGVAVVEGRQLHVAVDLHGEVLEVARRAGHHAKEGAEGARHGGVGSRGRVP